MSVYLDGTEFRGALRPVFPGADNGLVTRSTLVCECGALWGDHRKEDRACPARYTVNRYTPYYDADEGRAGLSVDSAGSWVHTTAFERRDAARVAVIHELHEEANRREAEIADLRARVAALEAAQKCPWPNACERATRADLLALAEADAARYRWLCDGHGYFMEEEMLCGHGNEKARADAAIDAAMREDGQ